MKKIILFLIIGIFVTSCDDFTDLEPTSNRDEAEFYTTTNDFLVAINASYAGLQDNGVYGRAYWTMFEMRGDNTDQGPDQTGLAKQFTDINAFSEDALNELVDQAWIGSYRIIANCNVILGRINDIEIDATLKNRITGEALFLRSLMYYHLAIAYDNIPLKLDPFVFGEEELTQVDATTVYTQLVTDLETAESNLEISYAEEHLGRATKGAAATLLAKVLLTMGNNPAAETVLRRIVNDYNYNLLDNYADLWGANNENNAESIFEVQFLSGGSGQGSAFTNDFSPDASLQTGQGFGRNRPTATLRNAYEANDLRFGVSMETSWIDIVESVSNPEIDSMVTVEQNYVTKFKSDPPTENDSDINFVVFRYADVLLMLAEAIGESEESYGLINQVRARAGLSNVDASSAGTFEEKLLHERQVELAFENHRWPDLRRFGVAAQMVSEAESIDQGLVKELFLIPQREIDLNPNFTQN